MTSVNRRIVLAARPHGEPNASHFRLEEARLPTPKAGRCSSPTATCPSIPTCGDA